MNNRYLKLFRNACANLVRGGAVSLVGVVLPPLLIHVMPADRYSAWMLVLQLGAVSTFLDFGLQTLVGRFIAHAEAKGERCDDLVSTATAVLAGAALLGLIITAALAYELPLIFRHMPAALVPQARIALLLVGGSAALGLPATVGIGIFNGRQRNDIPAVVIALGKILGAALVVDAAHHGAGLVPMAGLLAAANLLSSGALCAAARRWAGSIRFSSRLCTAAAVRRIIPDCVSLSIWSAGMLMVNGLDVMLVGHFDYRSVAPYTVAATVVIFLAGLQNSLFSTLIPEYAALNARGETQHLQDQLVSGTRLGMFLLLLLGIPIIAAARPLMTLWSGPVLAGRTAELLQILVLANIIRSSAVPYAMLLIGTGQQKLITITPLVEGVTNVAVSVIAAAHWGAAGVAFGTAVGSLLAILCNLAFNMPRTQATPIDRRVYLVNGLLRPLICLVPGFILAFAATGQPELTHSGFVLLAAGCGPALLWALWHWGLDAAERDSLTRMLRRRPALREGESVSCRF